MKNAFWVGIFERDDESGYATTRHVFGKEPTDPELYQFISEHFHELNFTEPRRDIELVIKRKNYKRMMREVQKEVKTTSSSMMTRSQEVLKDALEEKKKVKKVVSSEQKLIEKEKQFQLKQAKKKQKQRGH